LNVELERIDVAFEDFGNAILGLESSVVTLVFPCGEGNSEEILLSTSEGLVAYFEKGTKRYLSVLSDGAYKTTDGFKCNFKIVNGFLE
jgi:hypothetical protein